MSIKSKVLATAATLTLVGGVAAAGALTSGTAHAATPSAGFSAVDLFNHEFGHTSLLDVYKRGTAIGTPIILFQASNEDPAEDFTVFEEGLVGDFFKAGLVSAAFNLHYSNDVAVELQYSPYGVGTGECVGTAVTAVQGAKVSLQPCGVSSKTVWAVDTNDPNFVIHGLKVALANGSTTNFSFPQVMTYPQDANPVDRPRAQVDTEQITGFFGQIPSSTPGVGIPTGPPIDRQLWSAFFGPVH